MEKEKIICNKCGSVVVKETDEELQKIYKYYCINCGENLFEFETHKEPTAQSKKRELEKIIKQEEEKMKICATGKEDLLHLNELRQKAEALNEEEQEEKLADIYEEATKQNFEPLGEIGSNCYKYNGYFIELRLETLNEDNEIDFVIFESEEDLNKDFELNILNDYYDINNAKEFWQYIAQRVKHIKEKDNNETFQDVSRQFFLKQVNNILEWSEYEDNEISEEEKKEIVETLINTDEIFKVIDQYILYELGERTGVKIELE